MECTHRLLWQPVVHQALMEDLGYRGDVTTHILEQAHILPPLVHGAIVARADGCLAGLTAAQLTFNLLDTEVHLELLKQDGQSVQKGECIMRCSGAPASILGAERVALNFLGHLSGIATQTRIFVQAVEGTRARVCATRKTLPGLRSLEKEAVCAGGGLPHRFGLNDAILIKDNHIQMAGGITPAVRAAQQQSGHMLMIQVEVDTFVQLQEAMDCGVSCVLLDNMSPQLLRQCVDFIDGRALSEASGGVHIDNVRAIAETGVDFISCGALTHSAPCLDVALDVEA